MSYICVITNISIEVALTVLLAALAPAGVAAQCDRAQTPWCAGDVVVGGGVIRDEVTPVKNKASAPVPCNPGEMYDSNGTPFIDPATGYPLYDCSRRQNAGTYFLYDQNGTAVAASNGVPTKIRDGLAAGVTPADAQTQQPASSVNTYDAISNTNVTTEQSYFTNGCAQDPTTGGLVTTGFWSNVVSQVPFGATSPSKTIDLGSLTRVACGTAAASLGDMSQCGGAESVVFDKQGNFYLGTVDGTNRVLKFTSTGDFVEAYSPPTARSGDGENRGTDWIELAADGKTMYFSSESNTITVFRTDGLPLTTSMVATPNGPVNVFDAGVEHIDAANLYGKIVIKSGGTPISNSSYGLRLLPAGDGGGGLLVAVDFDVFRIDLAGNRIRGYVPSTAQGLHFFAVDVTPDASYFWTANLPIVAQYESLLIEPSVQPTHLFKFHIASGDLITNPPLVPAGAGSASFGLCVLQEYAAGARQPDCSVYPTDSLCTPIPTNCTSASTNAACTPGVAPKVSVADQTWTDGDTVSVPIQVTDTSGTRLTITSSWIPDGLHLVQSPPSFSGTLSYNAHTSGTASTVTVTNGLGLSATATLTWVINYKNGPPVLAPGGVSPSQTIVTPHGVPLTSVASLNGPITIQSQDPDSCDRPIASLAGAIGGLTVSSPAPDLGCVSASEIYTTTVTGTPYPASLPPGGYPAGGVSLPVTVTLTDGVGNKLPILFSWTITNTPPTLVAPANQAIHVGTPLSGIRVTATDANNDPITVGATGVPDGVTFNADATFTGAPIALGTFATTITAADNVGGVTSTSFTWNITDTPPVVVNPRPRVSKASAPVALQITAFDPDPGDRLAYSATGLPPTLSIAAHTGLITGYAPPVTAPTTYNVLVTVTDGYLPATAAFTWIVTPSQPDSDGSRVPNLPRP